MRAWLILFVLWLGFVPRTWADRVDSDDPVEILTPSTGPRLRIDAPGGRISSSDLFRGFARLDGYDDRLIRPVLPSARFSIRNRLAMCLRQVFNWLMAPSFHCHVDEPHEHIEITMNRAAARESANQRKARLRSVCETLDWRASKRPFGIHLMAEESKAHVQDVAILVHGFNSSAKDLESLAPVVRDAQLVPAVFCYPNDQPIEESASLLSSELAQFKRKHPFTRVALLTHSMGGLVARCAVELPELDPGNVDQLIMIAPPNHGSMLANVAGCMDFYDLLARVDCRPSAILDTVIDGLGEASADLQPRSVFLNHLNSHTRNPRVRYTILLGTSAPFTRAEMDSLRRKTHRYTDPNKLVRFAASKLTNQLDHLEEVIEGCGDGAVSIESGQLNGVEDIVKLPFSHTGVLVAGRPESSAAHTIIGQRLQGLRGLRGR